MKIKKLHIDSYRHLQNVDFDFTYPEGHEKAGKPLEKICIIGQSATGKTSVLELIKNSMSNLNPVEVINEESFHMSFELSFDGQIECQDLHNNLTIKKNTIIKNGKEIINKNQGGSVGYLIPEGIRLLYLSSELISREAVNIFNQNPVNIFADLTSEVVPLASQRRNRNEKFLYEFGQEVNTQLWFSLLYKILDYRKRFTQMASELINKGAIGDLSRLNKKYAEWSANNENPLVAFASHFNPILKKLNLEIDLVNTEYPIPVKMGNTDEVIPVAGLSTGTKGLLLSMFPLYELDTTDSMILMDEPERSLFPDLQIDLMSHYQSLAPGAQFIVATHSPFIAAAFEPEERFILYFDEDGKVAVHRGVSPIGDDPNDMLTNDFNVNYYNSFGKDAYERYLKLKRDATQETEPSKKKELMLELVELGDKYNF